MSDAVDGQVGGEDERREPGLQRLCDDVITDFTVSEHVDLQPARGARCRSGDVARRGRCDGRQAHQRPGSRGALGHGELVVLVGDRLEGHGRDERGHRDRGSENRRLGRHRRDVDEHSGAKAKVRERLSIPAQSPLVAGAAGDVAPGIGRHDLLGQPLRVVESEKLVQLLVHSTEPRCEFTSA